MEKIVLKILMVEDTESDVDLAKMYLEKAGFTPEIKNVWTRPQLLEALDTGRWDLILSDYTLPEMNGLEILKIKQEKKPEIPFVIFTGTIGEETAVGLLKNGADDYLLKKNLVRLGPAVQQVLQAARDKMEKRINLEELQYTESMLSGIADGIEDRLLLLSSSYQVMWANKAAREQTGFPADGPAGKTCHEILFGSVTPCQPPLNNCPLHGYLTNGNSNAIYELHGLVFEVKIHPIQLAGNAEPYFIHVSRDITSLQESRVENIKNLNKQQKLLRDIIEILTRTMEVRDPYTTGHQKSVSRLATAIAHEMGIDQQDIEGIYLAAIIHDLGKIAVPTQILSKAGKLDDIEMAFIKMHPKVAYDILKKVDFPWPVARAVYEHHERLNGSGYPNQLSGDQICIQARVLAVADVVEAIAANRPYRPAIGIDAALGEIEKNTGILYDPGAVTACLRLFREKGFTLKDTLGKAPE